MFGCLIYCCALKYSLIIAKSGIEYYLQVLLRITWTTFKLLVFIFIILFVILPLVYKYCYRLQRAIVFLNFINLPANSHYENPSSYGLEGTRNFYLTTDEGVKLGVWHILPESLITISSNSTIKDFDSHLSNGQNVIIYNHGNAGSRATPHRVELYKVLRKHFHVIAYDYRSYGDSSNIDPSEPDLVKDCMYMIKWTSNRTGGNVFVWGHSLGTSLSVHALAILQREGYRPSGLFLESPFTNFRDEISEFPMSRLFKYLPWFSFTVVEPMLRNNFRFESDRYIVDVDVPMLIMHAEDDNVVPFRLGYKLYETAIRHRNQSQGFVKMVKFDGKLKYGHKYICRDPQLNDIVKTFIADSLNEVKIKKIN